VDGLRYREGLNAVGISGGVAGNVIPDRCVVTVNYRFAPDRDITAAERHLREVFAGWDVTIVDAAPSARPGLSDGPAASFAAAVGGAPRAKLGWTDVARFAELGIPAVNYGPGISELSHTKDEYVEMARIGDCEARLRRWLSTS
jgi:succinyl-diaminopimelate desuccinylase